MGFDEAEIAAGELQIAGDEEALLDELGIFGESRRRFLGQAAGVGLGALVLEILAEQKALAFGDAGTSCAAPVENPVTVSFSVNGAKKTLELDSRMTLQTRALPIA